MQTTPGIKSLQIFAQNYNTSVLSQETYTPQSLLSSFKQLLSSTKQAFSEIKASVNGEISKPAYAAGSTNGFLYHTEFKTVYIAVLEKASGINYTNYAHLKKGRISGGIEMPYKDLVELLIEYSSQRSLWLQLSQYEEMLGLILAQDKSINQTAITRFTNEIKKANAPMQMVLKKLSTSVKDDSKDLVKVSQVIKKASDWDDLIDRCSTLNAGYTDDAMDVQELDVRLRRISGLIDAIIEDTESKSQIKGNSMLLAEISQSTLALAEAVTLRATGIALACESLGCIYETAVAVTQE